MPNLPSRDFLQNLDVKEGETLTMDCPKCNGVKKFSISNRISALHDVFAFASTINPVTA